MPNMAESGHKYKGGHARRVAKGAAQRPSVRILATCGN
jgi:hypothetical protein